MAIMLGKRKRRSQLDEEAAGTEGTSNGSNDGDLQALFRKHFEAQFEPLPDTQHTPVPLASDIEKGNDGESTSDWEGLSDENEPAMELIQHTTPWTARPEMTKEEYKIFMVC